MSGKILRILALAMVMSLISDAGAAVVPWNGSADPFWSTPGNWDGGSAPTSADTSSIGMVPGPVVANEGIVADIIWVGAGRAAADLTVDGGTLMTNKWVIVGINTGSNGTVNMKSGTFTINSTLLLGDREEGTGHVNLDGGVLTVNNLEMRRGADTVGTIDVQPYTVQWTVVSEPDDPNSPDAVIADSTAEITSITMSAVGEYVLQLDAFDGEYTGSDTVTINVYADSCEATKALPDYEPLVGDLNGDCKVDDLDMALLQENWLKDISLTEEVELD